MKLRKKYRLSIDVTIDSDSDSDFSVVESNLNLLPDMANDFGLFTDGSEAELDSYSVNVEEVSESKSKKKPKKV